MGAGQVDKELEQSCAAEACPDWRSRSFDIQLKDCGQLPMEIRVVNGCISQLDSFDGDLIGYPLKNCPREGDALVIGDLMGGTLRHPFGIEGRVLINSVIERKDEAEADVNSDGFAPSWIESLRFAIQARLFLITHGLHDVLIRHNAPGNVVIVVDPAVAHHVSGIAQQLLPVGTGVEVVELK